MNVWLLLAMLDATDRQSADQFWQSAGRVQYAQNLAERAIGTVSVMPGVLPFTSGVLILGVMPWQRF